MMTLNQHAVAAKTSRRMMDSLIVRCEPFIHRRVNLLARNMRDQDSAMQAGRIGLARAAELFEPERGAARFLTYAAWWVRAYVNKERAREQGEGHVPAYAIQKGIDVGGARGVWWLDKPIPNSGMGGADDEQTYADRLRSAEIPADVALERHERNVAVRTLTPALAKGRKMKSKDSRLRQTILDERLLTDTPRTLSEIGEDHGCSREWVRQREEQMIRDGRRVLAEVA